MSFHCCKLVKKAIFYIWLIILSGILPFCYITQFLNSTQIWCKFFKISDIKLCEIPYTFWTFFFLFLLWDSWIMTSFSLEQNTCYTLQIMLHMRNETNIFLKIQVYAEMSGKKFRICYKQFWLKQYGEKVFFFSFFFKYKRFIFLISVHDEKSGWSCVWNLSLNFC